MERLLGLLLVGCPQCPRLESFVRYHTKPQKENAENAVDPSVVVDEGIAITPDPPTSSLEDRGAEIERNEQGKVVRVSFFMNEHIFDAGLVNLREFTDLKWLYLNAPQVTDKGMVQLKELTSLEKLWLRHTQITDAGIAELRKALPNCSISY